MSTDKTPLKTLSPPKVRKTGKITAEAMTTYFSMRQLYTGLILTASRAIRITLPENKGIVVGTLVNGIWNLTTFGSDDLEAGNKAWKDADNWAFAVDVVDMYINGTINLEDYNETMKWAGFN